VVSEATRASEAESPTRRDLPAVKWNDDLDAVLETWRLRAWASQIAHYQVAERLRRRNRELGLPVVILTTAVGTSLFATLNQDQLAMAWRIVVGTISVLAAVFAGIQAFFAFAQRADQHVLAADWYSSIRRRIEQLQAMPRASRGDARECLDGIRKEMNHVGSQFPEIGEKTWNRVASRFGIQAPPEPARTGTSAPAEVSVP
jgi:hypothetical protein